MTRSRISTVLIIFLFSAIPALAQTPTPNREEPKQEQVSQARIASGELTGEQVAELSIAIYGFGGGRVLLDQIRKTAVERGRISVANAAGGMDSATYQRWFSRAEGGEERTRLDQQFPNARFSLVLNGSDLFGIFNDASFVPREDAATAFRDRLFHSIDAYLRYKENGSTVVRTGREKIMGVDYHILDMTDKNGRKTRYYVSLKTFRVMMLEYESAGNTYRRRFYDYRYAQSTLVPYRSVLTVGDKVVEEINVGTITFGQKVDDGLFTKPTA